MASAATAPLDNDERDENALMARVLRHDAVAFRALAEGHGPVLYRIAYRMIGDAVEAEDIAQEALLRLWREAVRLPDAGIGPGAWLHRVAVNLCLDRLRRKRFTTDAAVPDRADEAPSAPELMDDERRRRKLVAAIASLPDRQRAAVILTYYEDQPNAVAAETMEMNIKAFESLLLRARSALRTRLGRSELGETA